MFRFSQMEAPWTHQLPRGGKWRMEAQRGPQPGLLPVRTDYWGKLCSLGGVLMSPTAGWWGRPAASGVQGQLYLAGSSTCHE